MVNFITRMIETKAKISIEQGREKYYAYFIHTNLYAGYKDAVDAKLKKDGFEEVIVEG